VFNERPGRYWNWTSATVGTIVGDVYSVSATSGALSVSWASLNAGLENGETYVVMILVTGTQQGQAATTCIPNGC